MRSNGIPVEFEDLLSRAGRRVLAGTHPLCGALANPRTRFLAAEDLLDRAKVARVRRTLEAELPDVLEPIEKPIPPDTIFEMKQDYAELLPKSSRARTIYFESRREPGVKAAERIGLAVMMRSQSFRAFAEALAGRKLKSGWGLQVLRYGPRLLSAFAGRVVGRYWPVHHVQVLGGGNPRRRQNRQMGLEALVLHHRR